MHYSLFFFCIALSLQEKNTPVQKLTSTDPQPPTAALPILLYTQHVRTKPSGAQSVFRTQTFPSDIKKE